MLRIRVSDTGVGVPPQEAAQLLGEFAQLNQGIVGGQGLGLYTARASLRRIGGNLTFAPNVPSGASFTMTVPYSPAAPLARAVEVVVVREEKDGANAKGVNARGACTERAADGSAADKNNIENRKRHILVVDDDQMLRWLYATLVKKYGYDVTTASNGAEAVEVLRTTAFDAMITDMNMPSPGDGLLLLRECREKLHIDIPVAVLSGCATESQERKSCDALRAHYFQKGAQKNIVEHVLTHIFPETN